ncbi:cytochrome P450 3A8 [Octopus vulgaris]|uniref:Cytochrome P450 3A8 n=1 Tax=Octopus vulgaris TaxID=6645 RepID=A0AA36BV14_OCTVU|nr:cytochrome P450 3A8 [Octopus vulgaris]
MDIFGLTEIGTTFVLGVLLIITIYLFGRRRYSLFKELGIPGPEPVCYLGNMIELKKRGFCYAPKYWREVYGDTYGVFLGANPYLVTSDPEIIQEVLVKRFSNFTNRTPFVGDIISKLAISEARDDHWKYLRTVLAPSYTSHQMRGMNTMIQTCADNLVENIGKFAESKEICDVKTLFSAYTIDVIAATGFGIMVDSQKNPNDSMVKNLKEMLKISFFTPMIFLPLILPFTRKIIETLLSLNLRGPDFTRKFCTQLIHERKKSQMINGAQNNLLDLMIKAQLKGHEKLDPEEEKELHLENITDWRTKRGITDDEILAQCGLILIAGYETTASTLTFFLHLMSVHPESQQKIYEEIEDVLGEDLPNYENVQKLPYLEMCLNETLRLYPIGTALDRQCKNTCTINGVKIPEGITVKVGVYGLHYDPKYWPEPEKFIPERFSEKGKTEQTPFTFLPFGGGPRICLGMRLAKLEFKIAVVQVIRKFKILPTEKTEDPPVLSDNFFLSAKSGIWAKFERR